MHIIVGFLTFVFLKIAFGIAYRMGIPLSASLVLGILAGGLALAFQTFAGLQAGRWGASTLDDIDPPGAMPVSVIAGSAIAYIGCTVLLGHLVVIGFSRQLAYIVADQLERGNFLSSLLFAVPAALNVIVSYFALRRLADTLWHRTRGVQSQKMR